VLFAIRGGSGQRGLNQLLLFGLVDPHQSGCGRGRGRPSGVI